MQNTYIWRINPLSQPAVLRNCPTCGRCCEYESSGNFRVNANQSHIDVWLIYQCKKCKNTWNMEILSRVNPKTINKELYLKFLNNDPWLAGNYAFDIAAHRRNRSVLSYENLYYEISGEELVYSSLKEDIQIELLCEYPIDLRLDKLLSRKLKVSREQVKKLCNLGKILAEGIPDVGNVKVKDGMRLTLLH